MADKRQRLIYEIVSQGAVQLGNDLKNIQDLLVAHTKSAQESGKAIVDAISKESNAVAELIKQQNELQKTANETRNKQLLAQAETTKATQEARTAIQAQNQALKDTSAQYGAMKDQLTGLVGLAVSVFSINAIKNYATEVIDAKTKVDLFSLSLTSMIGNKKLADEVAGQVFEIAKRSPFEVEQLITTTQKLKAMGVETEKLVPYIKALGDISAYVGTDKLPYMAKAMVDVQNKGKLMAQEINQFSNAGVPLFDLLAKSMNKTKEEVISMAREHTISFAMVERAILGATEKGGAYYNGMANSAKSLGGQVSNLSDLFFLGKAKIGDYFENGLQKGITIIGDFLKATIGSNEAIQRTISYVTSGAAIWLSYRVAVISTNASLRANQVATLAEMEAQVASNGVKMVGTGVTTSLTTATRGLWLAISANPIGFLITAVGLAIGAYQAFQAVTTEVTHATSEEENMLLKTKVGYEANLRAIANTTVGTKERTEAVVRMNQQYPGYNKNINLETANQNQLAKQLLQVNQQLERKIRLAGATAEAEALSGKAVEMERQKLQLVVQLRKENEALSQKYINDETFLFNLQKSQRQQLTVINMAGTKLDMNNVTSRINQYKTMTGEIQKVENDINKVINSSNQTKAQIYKEDYANLRRQLRDKQISVKEFNDAVAKLDDKQVSDTKINDDKIVANNAKSNKKRAENHALTAKEIAVIELKSAEQTLETQKKLANAEFALGVEQANKKFKNVKDGETKISIEVQRLFVERENKLNAINAEALKKRSKEMERWMLIDTQLTDKQTREELADLEDKLKKKIAKEISAEDKANDELEKLEKAFRESQLKLEDAQNLKRELANAKTATEKYAITMKYGRKTNDELEALEIVRMQKEQKRLNDRMIALANENKQNTDEYKELHEAYLKISTDINNKIVKNEKEKADDVIRSQKNVLDFVEKTLLKMFDSSVKNAQDLSDIQKKISEDRLATNELLMNNELRLAGNNYEKRIEIVKDYSAKELAILTDSQKKESITANWENLNIALKDSLNRSVEVWKDYNAKVKATNASAASDEQKRIENTTSATIASAQAIGFVAQSFLAASARDNEIEHKNNMQRIDAKLRANERLYTETIKLAEEARDAKIAAINASTQALQEALQREIDFEIQKISILSGAKIQAINDDVNGKLRVLKAGYLRENIELNNAINAEVSAEEKKYNAIMGLRTAHMDKIEETRVSQNATTKFWYDKAMEQAVGNAEEQKRLTDEYNKAIKDTNDFYAQKKIDDGKYFDGVEIKAKEDLENAKTAIVDKYELQRLDKIKGKNDEAIAKEQEKSTGIINEIKKFSDGRIETINASEEAAKNLLAYNYARALKAAGDNLLEQKAITDKYENDKIELKKEYDAKRFAETFDRNEKLLAEEKRFSDEKLLIDDKYNGWRKDKNKQYEDEQREIIEEGERKKKLVILRANQDKIIQENILNQKKIEIQSDANVAINNVQDEFRIAEFKADQAYTENYLKYKEEALHEEANIQYARIRNSKAVSFAKIAEDPTAAVGQIFASLFSSYDPELEIGKNLSAGVSSLRGQRAINASRIAPTKGENANQTVRFIRDGNAVGQGLVAGGPTDLLVNPDWLEGHQVPIDYLDIRGGRFAVFDWIKTVTPRGIEYLPDFNRKYFKGSDYVERGNFPQGIDQIPAMVNEGEKIFTTEQSREMGGKQKPNEQIVKEVKFAEFVMAKMPNMMQMLDMPRLKPNVGSDSFNDERVIKALKSVEDVLKNKKTSNVNINVDKYKIDVQEHTENSRINYHNQIYNRNRTN